MSHQTVSVAEAAKILGHKYPSRVYSLIGAGRITASEVNGRTEVDLDSLNAYKAHVEERNSRVAEKRESKKVRAVPKPSKAKKAKKAKKEKKDDAAA